MSVESLVGRDRERGLFVRLLDGARKRGSALVMHGEPGIGKSALLTDAAAVAARRGMLVLSMSGVKSESNLAFAGMHQLLRPVLGHLGELAPRQRAALSAAFGLADGPTPEPFLIALAALELLSEAAVSAPVLVVAEDAHWLDRPSADALAFVARRVESDPVVVLAAVRDGYDSPLRTAGLPELHVTGLTDKPAEELLGTRFPELAPAVRDRLLAEAEGNPLALIELPAALAKSIRSGAQTLPARLPLTARLERAYAARAAELPRVTRTLLLVAAAGDGGPAGPVMAAAGLVLGAVPAVGDLVPAVDAQLIKVDEQGVRFWHPLVQSAIYQAASVAERHAAHAALAQTLAGDPDRSVWHRAAAAVGTDEAVAAELEEAARRARRRGGIITAAAAFERAAAFTGDPARRGVLLLSAAEAARERGQAEMVMRLLREARSCPLTPHDRAYALWLADAFWEGSAGDPARVRVLVTAARQTAADGDTGLALNLLSAAALRCYWGDLGEPSAGAVVSAADDTGAAPEDPLYLQIQAYAAPLTRGPAVLARLARIPPPEDPEALYLLGTAASMAGDFGRSCALLGACAARLREQGRLRVLAHALAVRAWSAIMIADFAVAMPAAAEAARLAAETAQPLWEAGAWTAEAALAALRGEPAVVGDLTTRAERATLPAGAVEPLAYVQYVRGLLALGQGRHADAYAQLRRLYEPGDPACDQRIAAGALGDLAEAAVRSGRRDHALAVVDAVAPPAAGAPAAGNLWSLDYARALLAHDSDAEAVYAEALGREPSPWPLKRARLQLAFGEWLRRQRRIADARVQLRAARDAFDALGTTLWGERARRELRASGEASGRRPPGAIDQLTPQELQIVQLAVRGLSNREIGERMYLSHRTVESHLYRVFPKLGITSRAQLGDALGELEDSRS
jgi:DNA-binding CsgD family transcriptional regulator